MAIGRKIYSVELKFVPNTTKHVRYRTSCTQSDNNGKVLDAIISVFWLHADRNGRSFEFQAVISRENAAKLYDNAIALCDTHDWPAALDILNRLASQYPDIAEVHYHAGLALVGMDRLEEAKERYRLAVATNPRYLAAHANLGVVLHQLGALKEALQYHNRALALAPQEPALHVNRASTRLLAGDFVGGFTDYEWRTKRPDMVKLPRGTPEWRGEALSGKSLLIHFEQGLGDTIQFCRYAIAVAAQDARVVLAVPGTLIRLLSDLGPGIFVVDARKPLPKCDYQILLLSLPHIIGATTEAVAWSLPYIRAAPDRICAWSKSIHQVGFLIGIAWQGRSDWSTDKGRSIPLLAFAPLAEIPGVRLISLQKHDGVAQLTTLPKDMQVEVLEGLDDGSDAFVDTAGVIESLDLVVTSDTAIAHLAGAMGKPVWLALKHVPDWRWMMMREDSPWYPSMRLFRQRRQGDWDDVFRMMAAQLKKCCDLPA